MADGYILIGDGTSSRGSPTLPNSFVLERPIAPISFGGAVYVVAYYNDPVNAQSIGIFKTTDAAAPFTFTLIDSVIPSLRIAAFYPSTGGNLIYLSYIDYPSGTVINILTFDMNTDTYSSVISSMGPAPITTLIPTFQITHRANGDWVVVYNSTSGAETSDVWWSKYNGSWSSPVQVSTVSSGANDSAVNDGLMIDIATGNIAIAWIQTYQSESYLIKHRYLTILSSGDVLGTNHLWFSGTTTDLINEQGQGVYNPEQDQWEYPFTDVDGGNPSGLTLGLLEAGPSAAPSVYTLTQGLDGGVGWFPHIAYDVAAMKLYFAWAVDYASPPAQFQYISRTSSGGSWSSPTTMYDSSVDSLIPNPSATASTVDLVFFGVDDGTVRMVSNPFCDFQYYFQFGEAPPVAPTLACPVGGGTATVGVPYSKFLVATGVTGTPTFAITGGALPSGLSLNTLTGEISGTPLVSGEFSITYTVTDSDTDLTSDPITCPIEIPHVRPGRKCPTL